MTGLPLSAVTRLTLSPARLHRLGQLTALDEGHLEDGTMRTVLRVDLRPELAPDVLAALTAAADPAEVDLPPGEIAWTSPAVMFTDTWTDEGRIGGGRMFEHAGGSVGTLPLPLMYQRTTSAMGGHDGAVSAGRLDTIDLSTAGAIPATGVFGDTDEGRQAAWDYAQGYVSGVSVDLRITDYELDFIEETDEDGETWIVDADFRATGWIVVGATGTPFPAFADARLEVAVDGPAEEDDDTEDPEGPVEDEDETEPIAAAAIAAGAAHHPPAGWFADPGLTELTPFTVDGDRVYGHLAPWEDPATGGAACHIGYSDVCVCAPRSASGYARFLVGEVEAADGTRVPVGAITLRGGHAGLNASPADAAAHYDNTDAAVAYVACGEDDHGIWIAGCVRPGISDDDRFALRASSLSGDWREWPARTGTLELLRVCCVNTPGFGVLRADGRAEPTPGPVATVEQGRVVAVAASGARRLAALKARALHAEAPATAGDLAALNARLAGLEDDVRRALAVTGPLDGLARERLLERL